MIGMQNLVEISDQALSRDLELEQETAIHDIVILCTY